MPEIINEDFKEEIIEICSQNTEEVVLNKNLPIHFMPGRNTFEEEIEIPMFSKKYEKYIEVWRKISKKLNK